MALTIVTDVTAEPVSLDESIISSQASGWNTPHDPVEVDLDGFGLNKLHLSIDEARVLRDGLSRVLERADQILKEQEPTDPPL